MSKRPSRWFLAYTLLAVACGLACKIATGVARLERGPTDPARPYRDAVNRLIDDALPPGWTVRRGLSTTDILDRSGTTRTFTYFASGGDGRILLVARRPGRSVQPPVSWDPTKSDDRDSFPAWLAGVVGPG